MSTRATTELAADAPSLGRPGHGRPSLDGPSLDGPSLDGPSLDALTKTCPSGPAEPGSVLLGMVVAPGQVAYLSPGIPVTTELLDSLEQSGIPIENRMRFSCKCMEHACQQWSGDRNGGRCGLADRAIAALAITSGPDELPRCGIRATCRWYAQHKAKACAACPEVIRRPAEK